MIHGTNKKGVHFVPLLLNKGFEKFRIFFFLKKEEKNPNQTVEIRRGLAEIMKLPIHDVCMYIDFYIFMLIHSFLRNYAHHQKGNRRNLGEPYFRNICI